MQAYRIVDWKRYEVTDKGKVANSETPIADLRKSGLPYVRLKVFGHRLGPAYRKLVKKAWASIPVLELAAFGLFCKLLELAADQPREFRGWILDEKQQPMNCKQIAELLDIASSNLIRISLDLLCDPDIEWLELLDFPLLSSTNRGDLRKKEDACEGRKGTLSGETLLNETETESKVNINESKGKEEKTDSVLPLRDSDSGSTSSPQADSTQSRNINLFLLGLNEMVGHWSDSDHTTFRNIAAHIVNEGYDYKVILDEIHRALRSTGIGNRRAFVTDFCKKKYGFAKTVTRYKPVKI